MFLDIINDNRLFKSDLRPSRFFFDIILFKEFLIVYVIPLANTENLQNNETVCVFEKDEFSEFSYICRILIIIY